MPVHLYLHLPTTANRLFRRLSGARNLFFRVYYFNEIVNFTRVDKTFLPSHYTIVWVRGADILSINHFAPDCSILCDSNCNFITAKIMAKILNVLFISADTNRGGGERKFWRRIWRSNLEDF